MALILPKGIVVNSKSISGDIERIDREPLAGEDISKLWKVYTTTQRRLQDPTAQRLENYWWRIWGSRARSLSGSTVARLFAKISDGETFVQLRSPANRDESGDSSGRPLLRDSKTSSSNTVHSSSKDEAPKARKASISSKSSGILPPPILKKSRGPSNNGPRPTARFISPHSSEDEKEESESESQLAARASPQSAVPSPTTEIPQIKEKVTPEIAAAPKRKPQGHVAVTAGHRRRPGIARRPSSQSSVGSENGLKAQDNLPSLAEATVENQPEHLGVPKRTLNIGTQSSSKFQENFSLSPDTRVPNPAKQVRQRPTSQESPASSSAEKSTVARQLKSAKVRTRIAGNTNESDTSSHDESDSGFEYDVPAPGLQFTGKPTRNGSHGTQSSSGQVSEKSTAVSNRNGNYSNTKPQLAATRSQSEHNLPSEQHALLPKLAFKSAPSPAPTTLTSAAATIGTVDLVHGSRSPGEGLLTGEEQHGNETGKTKETNTLFSKRPVKPVTGSKTTPLVPAALASGSSKEALGRSKSQLTLLLEKDKAHVKKNKESGSRRREKSR